MFWQAEYQIAQIPSQFIHFRGTEITKDIYLAATDIAVAVRIVDYVARCHLFALFLRIISFLNDIPKDMFVNIKDVYKSCLGWALVLLSIQCLICFR